MNQQDSCCTISQSAPGFACRRYETANYALKCCSESSPNKIYSNCVYTIYNSQQGNTFVYPTCAPMGINQTDVVCCNNPLDCVYNGLCYPTGTVTNIFTNATNNALEQCSNAHWCPEGYEWNPEIGLNGACEPGEQPCNGPLLYPSLTENCPWDILTNPTNYFLATPPPNQQYGVCLSGSMPPSVIFPAYESCCYDFSLGIIEIYEWENVQVYGNPSGSGFGSGE